MTLGTIGVLVLVGLFAWWVLALTGVLDEIEDNFRRGRSGRRQRGWAPHDLGAHAMGAATRRRRTRR